MYDLLVRLVEKPWFYWLARALFRAFALVYFRLSIEETDRVPRDGGLVLAVNHISGWDPPVVGSFVPREISFMAKKELFEKRATRWLMRGLHAFPVDRSRNDVSAVKEAIRRLRQGRAIGVFVQGTRTADGAAEALDGAAFLAQRTGVPLQPAAIWREGRRFHVRFGEPFEVAGRGREAIREATLTTMARVNEMLPSSKELPRPEPVASEAPDDPAERATR